MKKKKLLITGGTGLLAINWACALRNTWDVTLGTHCHKVNLAGVNSSQLVLEDPVYLQAQIDALAPDLVVHTAGLTSVDECELNPELAYQVNVEIAQNVALVAARQGAALIHISTDHLFSGGKSMCTEEDAPSPLNHYGRTKALAETAVLSANSTALILRTNFFGWGHHRRQSFSDWLVNNLRAGKPLNLYDNIFFTPILADELAKAAHQLIDKGVSGIFNLVGDQRLSKYEFASLLADYFQLSKQLLIRHSLGNSEHVAARPNDMSLDNSKARKVLGRNLGNDSDFLFALRQQELSGRAIEMLHSVSDL